MAEPAFTEGGARVRDFRSISPPIRGLYLSTADRLNDFYVPVLSKAIHYDRLVGYWRASSLSVAASGLVGFIRNAGTMRVIAGAELSDADYAAIVNGRPLEEAITERLLVATETEAVELIAHDYLDVLAWMLREGRLEIRIGIARNERGELLKPSEAGRLFHSKYGILRDAVGDVVVFSGSDNESATGWRDNHETFHVFRSWDTPYDMWLEHAEPAVADFATHWMGGTEQWQVIDLPTAVRERLIERVSDSYRPPKRFPS